MSHYTTTLDIGQAKIASTDEIIQLAVQYAEAHIEDGSKLVITFEVSQNGIPDLWDLRTVVEELEANLSSYFDCHIEKPIPIAPPTPEQ